LVRREGRKVAGRGGIRVAAPGRLAARWGRRKEGERVRLTGGAQVSARAKKRKKRVVAWTGAGKGWWAAGPLGPKGKKGLFFLFFLFFFKLLLKQLFFPNSNQILSNFSQKFYKLFRNHTSNQKPCKAN
jgi:hypothetical protein